MHILFAKRIHIQKVKICTLSLLAEAMRLLSKLNAISDTSAECPLRVAKSLPSTWLQIFTRWSSAPCHIQVIKKIILKVE